MNPNTDTSTQVKLSSGHIVTVIQPGGRIVKSKNWRLNEDAYRRYEAHIRQAIAAWPRETCFEVPNGMSPNTFEHRLRDALQAIKLFGYDPDVQQQLAAIREELSVSMDPDGKHVWIRERGRQGRPIQMHTVANNRPQAVAEIIHDHPDLDTLKAWALLAAKGVRTEPVQFRGRLLPTIIDSLQSEYDVAFAYDEASEVTTML